MLKVDVHQHLLGEELIEALARRSAAPALVRRDGGWTFRVAGEPDSTLAAGAVDVGLRGADLAADGVDRALVALSTALGIESLPAEESAPLIEAHHRGIEALPDEFGGWGAVQLEAPDPADVDAALDRGCVGIALPAAALAHPAALAAVGPLLERLEERSAPLFVHPGPVAAAVSGPLAAGSSAARGGRAAGSSAPHAGAARSEMSGRRAPGAARFDAPGRRVPGTARFDAPGRRAPGTARFDAPGRRVPGAAGPGADGTLGLFGHATTGSDTPLWWPALTDYVAQMQAAWFAFLHAGRRDHPRLRVLFAMLAGGAPLQLERYGARSGSPVPGPDPLVFYDTSSYGPRMIAAVREVIGAGQLVYGSDRPVVDPSPAAADPDLRLALLATNPSRLFDPDPKGALA